MPRAGPLDILPERRLTLEIEPSMTLDRPVNCETPESRWEEPHYSRGTGDSNRCRGRAMVTVTVCVGSSCHVRGARDVLELFKAMIQENGLGDRVRLKGCFCMERCTEGVNMDIDGQVLNARSVEEARSLFRTHVLAKLAGAP